jgi:hypothetical protein
MARRAWIGMVTAAALSAGPALAQPAEVPLSEHAGGWAFEALGQRLLMPFPAWLSDADIARGDVREQVEARFFSDERQALVEIIPSGEEFTAWSTLYAARITLEPERPLPDYRRSVMFGYAQTCNPNYAGFFQLGEDRSDTELAPLGFVCGEFLDRLEGFAGQGEVVIMAFQRSEESIAVVYQEWRGPRFELPQPDTWPVETAIVEGRAGVFRERVELATTD